LSPYDSITSVSWMQRGTHIAVGTNKGFVQLWDVERTKKIRQFGGHSARVGIVSMGFEQITFSGVLAWNLNTLTSGGRDRRIFHRDVRESSDYTSKLFGHTQEVCGLEWNPEGAQLASGGNDNQLLVWDVRNNHPTGTFKEHTAAVKAIAWSPHAVRSLRFYI
jgi:cell division cycle 20-like protein 1 (cofactor of APC complex)